MSASHAKLMAVRMQTVRDEEHNREAEAVEISSQNALVAESAPREKVAGSSASKPVYINDNTRKAEILFSLFVVDCNLSFRNTEETNMLFKRMFPDSAIAELYSCGRTKTMYLFKYGHADYFKDQLLSVASSAECYVVSYGESMNRCTKTNQMDLHIRFWHNNEVQSFYFNSRALGHARADDVLKEFEEFFRVMPKRALIQVARDGPNVNWSFMKKLEASLKFDASSPLPLDIGSCGLHTTQ